MKMNLKEAEQELLERIEKLGYTRYVDHQFYTPPMPYKPDGPNVSALTVVFLKDGEDIVATGEAWCSAKEQFHRQKGRVIATARALKDFERRNIDEP
mgnify:CR=1 FL=1